MFFPNTTISIYRGTAETALGSFVTSTTPIATGIAASIIDSGVTSQEPETGRGYEVHTVTGRVNPTVDVLLGDRVRDERDGKLYEVLAVTVMNTHVAHTKRLSLREVHR